MYSKYRPFRLMQMAASFMNGINSIQRKCSASSSTIFALSSGPGRSGVAVIRVSGPKSLLCLQMLCGGVTKPRVASLCPLMDPHSREMLDKALVLWFPGPRSFTGEDCVEFHVHGGPAVITSVLTALASLPGLKPAQAGEFTKQAFINGKLDLTEVEGLGDLIHAETEAQRKQALRQMDGELGRIYSQWRTRLIKCMANTEAFIDFHEEENIEDDVLDSVSDEVSTLRREISDHLNDNRRGERLRDGLHVVILGEPNVGKSSLLNVICQRPAAIVSPIAGTTRDVVETALNISGYPVLISDTAGLRDTSDIVEKEGVSRALNRASTADLIILMLDSEKHLELLEPGPSFSEFIVSYMQRLGIRPYSSDNQTTKTSETHPSEVRANVLSCDSHSNEQISEEKHKKDVSNVSAEMNSPHFLDFSNLIIVLNKCDLTDRTSIPETLHSSDNIVSFISCKTGVGLHDFMEELVNKIQKLCGDPSAGSPSLTQSRHRHHLSKCLQHLNDFSHGISSDVVIAAEYLRLAVRELGQVTGAVSAEDVLDVIFRNFCIGK